MSNEKLVRFDIAVADKLSISRTLAKDAIEKGLITVDGKVVTKSGTKVEKSQSIVVEGSFKSFVSRGGFKLQGALEEFGIDLSGLICMDVGAAAGGFSDCMLKNGAKKVYAIDSGSDQLKDELKTNTDLISMEQTDIRTLDPSSIEEIDFVGVDVSFISLEKIMGNVYSFMKKGGSAIFLVKPQFEAGKGALNKKGVIRNTKIHCKVLDKVYNYAKEAGFTLKGHIESPIKGGDGNIEFLMYALKP
jgi:23S rRNA (cytidine1920-2'-O)/16S rRNA (cytidine1409-2'-O)-methyltransferase